MPQACPALLLTLLRGLVLLSALAATSARAERHARDGFSFDHEPAPDWVTASSAPQRTKLPLEGSGAVFWWLNDTQQDLRGGRESLYRRFVGEALTAEGLERVAQPQIDFDPSYQRLVLHEVAVERAGKIRDRFDPQRVTLARRELAADSQGIYTGLVTAMIVIDDVRVGDRVHLAYGIEGVHPVLGRFGGDEFALALPVAQALRRVRILADEPLRMRVFPGYPAPRERRRDDGIEYEYLRRGVPALQVESDLPAWVDPIPGWEIAAVDGWGEVATWAQALYPAPQPASPALAAEIARISAAHSEPQARALAALRFVQDEIRYLSLSLGESTHRPAEPNVVFERRFGDCKDKSRLLVSMLGALGIEAVPALVHSSAGRALADKLPRAGVFDHVIVRMHLDDRDWWVDPTASLQRGGLAQQGFPDFGFALPVAAGITALAPIERPPGSIDSHTLEQRYVVDGQAATLDVESVWQGGWAEWMRRRLAADGVDALREEWRGYYARLHGELESVGEMRIEDRAEDNTVVVRDTLRLHRFLQPDQDTTEEFSISASMIGDFFPLPEAPQRKGPLSLPYPSKLRQHVVVELPDDVLPALESRKIDLSDAALAFQRKVDLRAGRFEAEFDAESRSEEVSGAALATHIENRRRLHDALGLGVSVQRVDARRASREDRMRALLRGSQPEDRP